MAEFYETRTGRQFYESTMPRIAEEMTQLNSNLEVLILLLTDLGQSGRLAADRPSPDSPKT